MPANSPHHKCPQKQAKQSNQQTTPSLIIMLSCGGCYMGPKMMNYSKTISQLSFFSLEQTLPGWVLTSSPVLCPLYSHSSLFTLALFKHLASTAGGIRNMVDSTVCFHWVPTSPSHIFIKFSNKWWTELKLVLSPESPMLSE